MIVGKATSRFLTRLAMPLAVAMLGLAGMTGIANLHAALHDHHASAEPLCMACQLGMGPVGYTPGLGPVRMVDLPEPPRMLIVSASQRTYQARAPLHPLEHAPPAHAV